MKLDLSKVTKPGWFWI